MTQGQPFMSEQNFFFFSQKLITLFFPCVHAAFGSVSNSFTFCPASFRFFHAPGSFRTQNPLCPAMISHAYFCDKSAVQVRVLITIRKLLVENVQKTNQLPVPVSPRTHERRRDDARIADTMYSQVFALIHVASPDNDSGGQKLKKTEKQHKRTIPRGNHRFPRVLADSDKFGAELAAHYSCGLMK